MGTLSSINIRFFADLKDFSKKMQNAERKIKRFGKSMKKVGTNLSVAVTAPIIALGGAAVIAWDKQAKAIAQVEQGLKTTGNAVGYTSDELQAMASELQNNSLFGDEEILKGATSQLLTFTNIAGVQFERTQQAALDLATRLDGDLKSASIQLGKALNDPVANLSALSRSGIQFSVSQKAMINSLVKTNRLAEAQTIILDELETQYGGSAEAAADAGTGSFKQLSNSIGDLTEDFGKIISEAIKPFVKSVKETVTGFKSLDDSTKRIIVKVAAFTAVVGPLTLGIGLLATNVVPGLITVFGVLRTSLIALKAAALANPWAALATGIALVVTAIIAYNYSANEAVKKTNLLNDVRDTAIKSIAKERAKLGELLSIARDENLSKGIRLKAIKDLNALSPKYLGNLKLETINTDAARLAVEKYTEALISSAKAKAASKKLEELQAAIIEEELSFHKEKEQILLRMQSIGIQTSNADARGAELLLTKAALLKEKEKLSKINLAQLNKEGDLLIDIIKKNKQINTVIASRPSGGGVAGTRPTATVIETGAVAGVELEPISSPLAGIGEQTAAELALVGESTDAYMANMERMKAIGTAVGSSVSDAFGTMAGSIVDSMGLADTGFQDFVKGLMKTIIKLIAMMLSSSIAQSISGATAAGTATGPAAVVTTPAFIATAVGGILSAFAAIPKFATGGIMGGNSPFGDRLLARINSGEMILNNKQQLNLAGMLQPVVSAQAVALSGDFRINGNDLVLSLDRTNQRNSRTR